MKLTTFLTLLFFKCSSVKCTTYVTNNLNDYSYEALNDRHQQKILTGAGFEMIDFLGLTNREDLHMQRMHKTSLKNSASKFLLEVYNELKEEEESESEHLRLQKHRNNRRHKRALHDDNFITELDRVEIEKCNNIITFSSRAVDLDYQIQEEEIDRRTFRMSFNTNDVPNDLQLVHSALRLYQDGSLGRYRHHQQQHISKNFTISIHQKLYRNNQYGNTFRILTSLNTTTTYKGWLEFNVTRLLGKWLKQKTLDQLIHGHQLMVSFMITTAAEPTQTNDALPLETDAADIGLVQPNAANEQLSEYQPFIIGYFNGPELMVKIQKLRFKRDVMKRKRRVEFHQPAPPPAQEIYELPKTCERLSFTLDFHDLQMHNWVIAPKKFEAYFCGGECNFPLASKMNATNHAIVQTLMYLKNPDLPKPSCVPTVLGSISILHYLNEDSVNLSKYPQSVARECGCH